MTTATWSLYTFMYKNSDQVVERVPATSHRQAIFKLKKARGAAWTEDALETGLIHLQGATSIPAPVTKATVRKRRKDRFEELKAKKVLWYMDD